MRLHDRSIPRTDGAIVARQQCPEFAFDGRNRLASAVPCPLMLSLPRM
jgi:hypothetical protein